MQYEYNIVTDLRLIYEYWCKVKSSVPYWFDTDIDLWKKSFSEDTDHDGEKMFSELITCAAFYNGAVVGFVQFGISCYIFSQNGEKDRSAKGGIIRQLFYDREHSCGDGLISIAEKYLCEMGAEKLYAFFHAFGMTCCAGHGKLYCGLPYIEQALHRYGYVKEHENVYYKRLLTEEEYPLNKDIEVRYSDVNVKGLCEFSVFCEDRYVGAGALVYLPQGEVCYLKWIYIEGSEQGRGYATNALNRIFADLYQKGIKRIDTDTADGNLIAQKLYTRAGFEDMGRTRSYLK